MTSESIAASDYEGWVAWVGGSPIFEAVPHNAGLLQLVRGAFSVTRSTDRNTMDWRDVPNAKIERFELYFDRAHWQQPAIRFDREPGHHAVRFIQLKLGGIVIGAHQTAARLGVTGYRVGYWDPERKTPLGIGWCEMHEIRRNGALVPLPIVRDPFQPKPDGHGYSRSVLGNCGTNGAGNS